MSLLVSKKLVTLFAIAHIVNKMVSLLTIVKFIKKLTQFRREYEIE